MPAGKLTIQAWHEQQAREQAWQIERDRQLDQLGREIESLGALCRRQFGRRPGFFRRFIRSINLGL